MHKVDPSRRETWRIFHRYHTLFRGRTRTKTQTAKNISAKNARKFGCKTKKAYLCVLKFFRTGFRPKRAAGERQPHPTE